MAKTPGLSEAQYRSIETKISEASPRYQESFAKFTTAKLMAIVVADASLSDTFKEISGEMSKVAEGAYFGQADGLIKVSALQRKVETLVESIREEILKDPPDLMSEVILAALPPPFRPSNSGVERPKER